MYERMAKKGKQRSGRLHINTCIYLLSKRYRPSHFTTKIESEKAREITKLVMRQSWRMIMAWQKSESER